MKFFIDLSKKQLIKSAASNVALDRLVLKRRDSLAVEVVFVSRNAVASMPAGTTTTVALKRTFGDSNFLALASGEPPTLNLNTTPLEAIFSETNPASISALLEIRWSIPGETTRNATLAVELQNSVILGTEGTPQAMPDGKSSEAEAIAGTDNEKWMTPLRTAQAIAELAPPPTWESVTGKPAEFPPAPHTADKITDFAEAVVAVSPPTTWENIPGKPATFPATAHTHLKSEITGLPADLAALSAADAALDARIDHLAANLDPAALDSIAEAAASINSLQTQLDTHTHTAADITDFASAVVAVSPPVDWSSLTGKPATFAPSAHNHTVAEVTGLTDALAGKATAAQGALADTALQPEAVDYRGAYDNGADYWPGQVVSYNGALYIRTGEPNPGYPPGSSYWTTFDPSASPAFKLWVDLSKADATHTHAATEITGLSDFIIASAPGLSINSTIRYGDGTSVTFPIDGLVSNDPESVLVALNGVTQAPVTDYTVSEASGTITFDSAPAAGTQIACTALGLRTVQPPIDPTLWLFAFDSSLDGLTTYSGRLLNADRPAAPALPETASTWTIKRTTLNAAGRVLATASATGSWSNRETLAYQ